MRHLLVINPNTSDSVTGLLRTHILQASGPDVAVHMATARFGARYISSEASYAIAGHATLDAWAAWIADGGPMPDAVLIGCFGDPGLLALRECSPVPVTGLAEAAFFEAAQHGRFAIVTGGVAWKPMLQRLAHSLGYGDRLAHIHTVQATGAELAADPAAARTLLAAACAEAAAQPGVQAVILGGAGLAGMAAQIQHAVPVPVVDSVLAGARQAQQWRSGTPGQVQLAGAWTGLSPALMQIATI
ncbi:aspartate/glutamate racemase family protein [Rhodoferax sp. WC2427]|uniref:aspartate/glutamate racemase family protein n=1 Tax=Rhodoferax sp. WC2427 TaxID=3234144 RepID=UPI0034652222